MIGLKHFATCKCNLPASSDRDVDPDFLYRFRCGKSQSQPVTEDAVCDFSLTIKKVQQSNTTPRYFKYKLQETDQQFESFHHKPLRAYLEFKSITHTRTLEKTLQTFEQSILKLPEHGLR